jgi:hypothetical protein
MKEKTAVPLCKYDFTGPKILDEASRNFDFVVRPKGRKHACAAHLQAQAPTAAQDLNSQDEPFRA